MTSHGLSVIGGNKRQKVKILKFRKWFKYGLKAQKLLAQDCYGPQAARPEGAEALSPGLLWTQAARPEGAEAPSPGQWNKQHALKGQKLIAQGIARKQHVLKGQKLLAQGIALGIMAISKAPCKGKSFINCLEF